MNAPVEDLRWGLAPFSPMIATPSSSPHRAVDDGMLRASSGTRCACGSPAADPRPLGRITEPIVGGTASTVGTFPTVAAVLDNSRDGLCSGVLIAPTIVVTAAHCIDAATLLAANQARPPGPIGFLGFDTTNVNVNTGTLIKAADTIPNPGFNSNHIFAVADIGVVKLSTAVVDRTPSPLLLDPSKVTVVTTVTQVEFGLLHASDYGGGTEASVVKIVGDCSSLVSRSGSKYLCFDQTDNHGICGGDYGGPSFVRSRASRRWRGRTFSAT